METLIKECIEKVKDDLENICDDATPGTTNCLSCFQRQYFDGNAISYDCDSKTYIYVARYFPVHVKEITIALNLMPKVIWTRLMSENPLNIISIGGGPGSDTFAVKKFLINKERRGIITAQKDVYVLRVDKEKKWNHIAYMVNSRVTDTELIKFQAKRKLCDITSRQKWPNNALKLYNIFTLSYFLSEMETSGEVEAVAEYINTISSDRCSVLFINDRDEPKTYRFKNILFKNLHTNEDFESEDNTRHHCDFFYDDGDRDLISPKLTTNSIRFFKVLYK